MANSFKPLRVKDVGSNFDASELSQYASADEEYIVYRAGYQVIASLGRVYPYRYVNEEGGGNSFSYPGTVGLANDPVLGIAADVGSIVDNHTTSALQSHPESAIVNVQTTTTVKVARNYAFDDADDFLSSGNGNFLNESMFRWPCIWDEDLEGFRFINTTEIQEIGTRMLGYLESNTMPGALYIGTHAPSDGDTWEKLVDSIHLDKIKSLVGVGINGDYHLWVKTQMASPPTNSNNRPLFVATDTNITNASHDWQGGNVLGLREMSDLQMGYTFGHFIASARGGFFSSDPNSIGTYTIRSGTQGAPTSPAGSTWVARGTVNDTRRVQSDTDYTRISIESYTGLAIFSGEYSRTRQAINVYQGNYTRILDPATAFQRTFTGNYSRIFSRYFFGNFISEYSRDDGATEFYSRISIGYYLRRRLPQFTRQVGFASGYSRYFFRTSGVSYVGNFVGGPYFRYFIGPSPQYGGNYVGNYLSEYARPNYQRVSNRIDQLNYARSYTRDSVRDYSRFEIPYTRNRNVPIPIYYIGNYSRTRNSERDYTVDETGFTGEYAGITVQLTEETVETYTLYVRTA